MDDVVRAYVTAHEANDQVAVLQCTASYPARFEEMDLRVITTYREMFPDAVIGLSSHDNGIVMPVVAYLLGARIIEKHFTLDRAMKGTDHAFSLEPLGMKKMIRDLKNAHLALGTKEKRLHQSELPALQKMGKKLVAARDLPAGHTLQSEDVAIKSPGGGVPPFELSRLIGQALPHPLKKDQAFETADLAPLPARPAQHPRTRTPSGLAATA